MSDLVATGVPPLYGDDEVQYFYNECGQSTTDGTLPGYHSLENIIQLKSKPVVVQVSDDSVSDAETVEYVPVNNCPTVDHPGLMDVVLTKEEKKNAKLERATARLQKKADREIRKYEKEQAKALKVSRLLKPKKHMLHGLTKSNMLALSEYFASLANTI